MARILYKEQGTQAVVRLIDQIQKTTPICQLCAGSCHVRAAIIRATMGVPTAVDPQPGCTIDGKLLVIFGMRLMGFPSTQVLVRHISATQRGNVTCTHSVACTDIAIEVSGKIKTILERLGGFEAVVNDAGDGDEFNQRVILFK